MKYTRIPQGEEKNNKYNIQMEKNIGQIRVDHQNWLNEENSNTNH